MRAPKGHQERESEGLTSSKTISYACGAAVSFSPSTVYEYSLAAVVTLSVGLWMEALWIEAL